MPKKHLAIVTVMIGLGAWPLRAQQPCHGSPVVINTPEDNLMQAVSRAENLQDQIAAFNKFAQENSGSKFLPCVNEYLTVTYLKLQDYDKAIEAGEKDLAANYTDLNLAMNMLKAYVASGKVSDSAFALVLDGPRMLHDEMTPTISLNVPAAEAEKARKATEDQAKDIRQYLEYSFFQLLPRLPDAPKRLQYLDAFLKAYPDTSNMNQVNFQYFLTYQRANNPEKMFEYGEKAVSSDPTNVSTLNVVADGYANAQAHLDQAGQYAGKALQLASSMQKSQGMSDEQFKSFRDTQMGLAHSTLGYVELQKGSRTHRVATAIQELKAAAVLLEGNPSQEARALYFLGYSYELQHPANHLLAAEALTKAANLESPVQAAAKDLLEKVKRMAQR